MGNERCDYYTFIVSESDILYGNSEPSLSGFSTNEWTMRQYVNQIKSRIPENKRNIIVYENLTYDEYAKILLDKYGIKNPDELYIQVLYSCLTDRVLYVNQLFYESFYDCNDWDWLCNDVEPMLYKFYVLTKVCKNYIMILRDATSIRMINKIVSVYMPIIKVICNYGSDCWDDVMTETELIEFNNRTNFVYPVDAIEYHDIVDDGYMCMVYCMATLV